MACKGTGEELEAIALQPAPRDEESMILRAGPDASILRTRTAVMFGAGALGGHVAAMLAESGVGQLEIVDPDVLLPGNVVRHIAGHSYVGAPKVEAVQAIIKEHAPWTEVSGCIRSGRIHRNRFAGASSTADIVIDATGNEALTNSLAMVAMEAWQVTCCGRALSRRIYRPSAKAVADKRYPDSPEG